jgi:hypothetical protein
MGEISRLFHGGKPEAARAALDEELSRGVYFKHQFETESWDFNTMVLEAVAAAGYRVLYIDRDREDERLFSMVVASHFSTWAREGIANVRERLRRQETAPEVNPETVLKLVRDELRYKHWIEAELPRHGLETLSFSYEAFFRSGLGALELADQVFAFAGLGARNSVLDDASLLRFIFNGEHYSLGLIEYSDQLHKVHSLIEHELKSGHPPA